MAYIILSIAGIIAVLLVRSTWSRFNQIIFALFIIVVVAIAYVWIDLFTKPDAIEKGPTAIISEVPWLETGLYFCMLAGMAGK